MHVFADRNAGLQQFGGGNITIISMDTPGNEVSPILFTVPLQMLAYHTALIKGTGIDQPRNLAKSVTVEWRHVRVPPKETLQSEYPKKMAIATVTMPIKRVDIPITASSK